MIAANGQLQATSGRFARPARDLEESGPETSPRSYTTRATDSAPLASALNLAESRDGLEADLEGELAVILNLNGDLVKFWWFGARSF